LLDYGADVYTRDINNKSILDKVERKDFKDIIKQHINKQLIGILSGHIHTIYRSADLWDKYIVREIYKYL